MVTNQDDIKILPALRAMSKLQFDTANRLMINPVTGTVAISGTPTITGTVQTNFGSFGAYGTGNIFSKIGFYKVLDRITFP